MVGTFNTIAGYLLYLLFLFMDFHYKFALGLSLAVMLVIGYNLSGHLVFGKVPRWRFWLYVLAWSLLLWLNTALAGLMVKSGVDERIVPLLIVPLNVMCSFLIQKFVVFRN
jgi:hypothetical protein